LQQEANSLNLDIRFVALIPKQISGGTELGQAAVVAYAAQQGQGISEQTFLQRFGAPLTPELMGCGVVDLLTDPAYRNGVAFGISGSGLASLDGA